jgi:hypothetical protein
MMDVSAWKMSSAGAVFGRPCSFPSSRPRYGRTDSFLNDAALELGKDAIGCVVGNRLRTVMSSILRCRKRLISGIGNLLFEGLG